MTVTPDVRMWTWKDLRERLDRELKDTDFISWVDLSFPSSMNVPKIRRHHDEEFSGVGVTIEDSI